MIFETEFKVLISDNGKYEQPTTVRLVINFDKQFVELKKGNDPQSQVSMIEIPFKYFTSMFKRKDD